MILHQKSSSDYLNWEDNKLRTLQAAEPCLCVTLEIHVDVLNYSRLLTPICPPTGALLVWPISVMCQWDSHVLAEKY